jgi:hypothetical protein
VVNQRTRRGLGQDSGDPADRERKPDALFVPLVASEVDREEWSDSGLDVGEKKNSTRPDCEAFGRRAF